MIGEPIIDIVPAGEWAGIPHATWFALVSAGRIVAIFERHADAAIFRRALSCLYKTSQEQSGRN